MLPIVPPPKPQEKPRKPTREERYEARRTRSADPRPASDAPAPQPAQIVKREEESDKEIERIAGVGEGENQTGYDPSLTAEEEMMYLLNWWSLASMPFCWFYHYD